MSPSLMAVRRDMQKLLDPASNTRGREEQSRDAPTGSVQRDAREVAHWVHTHCSSHPLPLPPGSWSIPLP